MKEIAMRRETKLTVIIKLDSDSHPVSALSLKGIIVLIVRIAFVSHSVSS